MNLLKSASKLIGIVDQVVEDKDKRNEIMLELNKLSEESYQAGLKLKTYPWVDALHKMGRQIGSVTSAIIIGIIIHNNPDIDIMKLAALAGPMSIYNIIKGKGK